MRYSRPERALLPTHVPHNVRQPYPKTALAALVKLP